MAVRLSALHAGCLLPPGRFLVLTCYGLSRHQGHSAARRIRSIEESNDLIGIEPMSLSIQDSEVSTNLSCTGEVFCFLVHHNVKMVMVTGKKFTLVIVTIPTECYTKPPYKDWTATWSSIMASFLYWDGSLFTGASPDLLVTIRECAPI
jgi:hypothetical protein